MENKECCSTKKCNLGSFLAGFLVFAIIAGGAYFIWNSNQEKNELKEQIQLIEEKLGEEKSDVVINDDSEGNVEEELEETEIATEISYPADTFSEDENGAFFGSLTVTGYPEIVTMDEAFCDPEFDGTCNTYNYVNFKVSKTYSDALKIFADSQIGNSFINENGIGLGCKDGDILSYYNDSEKYGMTEYKLDTDASSKIFNATAENPVTISLEKMPFFGGSGAPDCYMHFTEVTVY